MTEEDERRDTFIYDTFMSDLVSKKLTNTEMFLSDLQFKIYNEKYATVEMAAYNFCKLHMLEVPQIKFISKSLPTFAERLSFVKELIQESKTADAMLYIVDCQFVRGDNHDKYSCEHKYSCEQRVAIYRGAAVPTSCRIVAFLDH